MVDRRAERAAVQDGTWSRVGALCASLSWWSLLLLVGLVPVLTTNTAVAGTEWQSLTFLTVSLPKAVAIIVLSFAGLAGYAIAVAAGHERLRLHWLLIPVAVFVVWIGLSTGTSVSRAVSIFGDAERNEGALAYFGYAATLVLAVQVVRDRERLRTLAVVATLSGSMVAGYALLQYIGLDPLRWPTTPFGFRVFATFGNPDYLAGYLVFPLAFALGLVLAEGPKRDVWIGRIASVLIISALVISLVRVAWAAALLVTFVMLFAVWRGGIRPTRGQVGTLVVMAAAVVGLVLASVVRPQAGLTAVERLATLSSSAVGGSFAQRLQMWEIAIQAALQRPLLGWGPDTFGYAFRLVAGPAWWQEAGSSLYATNAHNLPLQAAATLGIPGALLYVGTATWALVEGARRAFRQGEGSNRVLFASVWAAALGLAFVLLFHVTTPMTVVWMWLSLGLLVAPAAREAQPAAGWPRGAVLIGAVVLIFVCLMPVGWLVADWHVGRGTQSELPAEQVLALDRAIALNPLPQEYWVLRGVFGESMLFSAMSRDDSPEQILAFADDMVAGYQAAVDNDPADQTAMMKLVWALSKRAELSSEPGDVSVALRRAQQHARRWPNTPYSAQQLANAQLQANLLSDALQSATLATELDPRYSLSWYTLGEILVKRGDAKGAHIAFSRVLELDPSDADAAEQLTSLQSTRTP